MSLRLFGTTVFRLSLVYALAFSLITATALGVIYWTAKEELQSQTDSRLQLETDVLLNLYRDKDINALFQTLRLKNEREGRGFFIYALIPREQQDLVANFKPEYVTEMGTRGFATMALSSIIKVSEEGHEDDPVRVLLSLLPGDYQLLVGRDINEQHAVLNKVYSVMIITLLVSVGLALLGGMLMGQQVLNRIERVRKTAGEIIEGDLSLRMPVTGRNNEFDQLSLTLNTMLQRIEQLMQGVRGVTDNLAHDLRKPLNRIRNRLEVTLLEARDEENYREVIRQTINDAEELVKTFNALLSIARVESGERRVNWHSVNLPELIEELGELYEAVAEEQEIQFSYASEPDLTISGNQQLMAQAITNLLDNAMKFTPPGGRVSLQAKRDKNNISITVTDTGPGIPPEEYQHVFERFVRLENARSTPGNGLGLSLTQAVAKLHNGNIELGDNHPGLIVTIALDISAHSPAEKNTESTSPPTGV